MDSGRGWQPYADHLVYSALAALPWGGSELAESAPAEASSHVLLSTVHKVLTVVRPGGTCRILTHVFKGSLQVGK